MPEKDRWCLWGLLVGSLIELWLLLPWWLLVIAWCVTVVVVLAQAALLRRFRGKG